MALQKQIDIAAGHEIIQFLNDPKPFGMDSVYGIKNMLKALTPSNIAEKKYNLENINSITCGTSQTGLGLLFGKKFKKFPLEMTRTSNIMQTLNSFTKKMLTKKSIKGELRPYLSGLGVKAIEGLFHSMFNSIPMLQQCVPEVTRSYLPDEVTDGLVETRSCAADESFGVGKQLSDHKRAYLKNVF